MNLSAEERAQRRATALRRLEETKRRLKQGDNGSSSSGIGANSHSGGHSDSNGIATGTPSGVNDATSRNGTSNIGQAPPTSVSSTVRDASKEQQRKSGLFAKPYIEYDFSTMQDSKGGFMVDEGADATSGQPQDIHAKWLDTLAAQRPPFDFDDERAPKCFECGTPELDFRLWRVFGTRVCNEDRRAHPEKYSLLTKTECKQDYLLTDPEMRDTELLPHLERPNPYQSTYSNMMLYMRYQVEEFAFRKWNGPDGLDAEYERRERVKKERKHAKFEAKLRDMRKKTRAQAVTSSYSAAGMQARRHVHKWSETEPQGDGTLISRCSDCGMTRTELALGH